MKLLHFFDPKSSKPRINPALGTLEQDLAERLAAYLKSGIPLISTTMRAPDLLTDEQEPVVPVSTVTDGEYVWSLAVAHYVEKHHLSPGDEIHHALPTESLDDPATFLRRTSHRP